MINGYRISDTNEDMDVEAIHKYLSQSYWASNIPVEVLRRSIKNSLCFGVFLESGEQVGFARTVTDKATFAYLADVFVLEQHRGKGLSRWLMNEIIQHPQLQGLRRMVLATRDAHGLYEKFGFKSLALPDTFMELHNPSVYK